MKDFLLITLGKTRSKKGSGQGSMLPLLTSWTDKSASSFPQVNTLFSKQTWDLAWDTHGEAERELECGFEPSCIWRNWKTSQRQWDGLQHQTSKSQISATAKCDSTNMSKSHQLSPDLNPNPDLYSSLTPLGVPADSISHSYMTQGRSLQERSVTSWFTFLVIYLTVSIPLPGHKWTSASKLVLTLHFFS